MVIEQPRQTGCNAGEDKKKPAACADAADTVMCACGEDYTPSENKATVRAAAKQFGVSKSTVHMDVARRLRSLNPQLYSEVREILDINKAQRHIRGGLATREKYKSMKEENK